MTIANNADLKSQVVVMLNRSNLTAQIPVFVQLCETRIAYGSKEAPFVTEPLRIRSMEASVYQSISTQKVALPAGYLSQRRFYINATPIFELKFIAPDLFWKSYSGCAAGRPREFTIEGENFVFGPTPDIGYDARLLFYQKFTPLSADTDTNWLLTNAPAAYLYGTLFEAYRFTRNMDQAQAALNTFSGIINSLNQADKSDRFANPWQAVSDTGNP